MALAVHYHINILFTIYIPNMVSHLSIYLFNVVSSHIPNVVRALCLKVITLLIRSQTFVGFDSVITHQFFL